MTPTFKRRWALALLFLAPAFWTVNYLVARWAPGLVAPHILAIGRWSMALVLMGLWLAPSLAREHRSIVQTMLKEKWQLLFLGALGMWICGAFVYQGGRATQAINIALIYAMSPVLITVVSATLLREKISWSQKLGLAMCLFGVLLVIGKGTFETFLHLKVNAGDWWIVIAATSWAAYSVLLNYWPSGLNPAIRLAAVTAGGLVVLLPFTIAEYFVWPMLTLPNDLWISWRGVGLMFLAAVFPGFLAYQSHSFLLKELGAARTSGMLYLGVIYAAGIAWLVLGEPVFWFHWVGAAFVLPGVYLTSRQKVSA
jgi:drug/metabolite transporter (DMT)-like permease